MNQLLAEIAILNDTTKREKRVNEIVDYSSQQLVVALFKSLHNVHNVHSVCQIRPTFYAISYD
jgi:hypothetical protein